MPMQEEANSGMEGSASVPVPLQSYVQAMQEQQDACLTPSGMDQPLRCTFPFLVGWLID